MAGLAPWDPGLRALSPHVSCPTAPKPQFCARAQTSPCKRIPRGGMELHHETDAQPGIPSSDHQPPSGCSLMRDSKPEAPSQVLPELSNSHKLALLFESLSLGVIYYAAPENILCSPTSIPSSASKLSS